MFQAIAETLKVIVSVPGVDLEDEKFLDSIAPAPLSHPVGSDNAAIPTSVADQFHNISFRRPPPSTSSVMSHVPVTPSVIASGSASSSIIKANSSINVNMVDRDATVMTWPKKPKKNNNKKW